MWTQLAFVAVMGSRIRVHASLGSRMVEDIGQSFAPAPPPRGATRLSRRMALRAVGVAAVGSPGLSLHVCLPTITVGVCRNEPA